MARQPPLFQAFRALGYITDSVPFAVQRRGKETFVTVSVGKNWQVYNTGKLTLVLVGPQLHGNIHALAIKGDLTLSAVGSSIVECKRVHRAGVYEGHSGDIVQLLVLGDQLLSVSVDGQLLVWKLGEYSKPQAAVQLPAGFRPSCMAHPDTYLNKVVVGSHGGQLLLVNFISGKVLYSFAGWGSAVKSVVSSPALDVVGVALADGRAALHNLKFDETLVVFSNAAGVGLSSGLLLAGSDTTAPHAAGGGAATGQGACTCLSFRTGAGVPLMAAGGGAGVITVWDLEQRKLHAVIQDAHDASVVALHFFAGEPLLMSAGADNAVKQWVFDSAQPQPRLLRFRSGHAAPPTIIKHYGEGLRLLTAGSDRAFRVFSTIQDQQSRELSQKHIARRAKRLKVRETELKLARVVAMDAATVRERDWANVITAHEGDATAYLWRLAHFTLGEHELRPPDYLAKPAAKDRASQSQPTPGGRVGAPVTAVALSSCGNFGIVGSASGRVDRYNMQSGIHRGVYARPGAASIAQQKQSQPQQSPVPLSAHDGAITGICVDSCNKLMVTTGLDGQLRIWDFKTQKCQHSVSVGSPITHLAHASGSGLVAVATDDLLLRCYDVEAAGRLVRRFKGHRDRITCMQLSSDSRWLISSSMDGSLRVWDVPAAQCLQVLRLGAPITSFSLPPSQDLLATCHVNRRGVYLWSNQAVFSNPALFSHSEQPVDLTLPSVSHGDLEAEATGKASNLKGSVRIAGTKHSIHDSDADASDMSSDVEDGAQQPDDAEIRIVSEEDEGYSEQEEAGGAGTSTHAADNAVEAATPTWQQLDPASGAPAPLAPTLVTLSLLPRAQWHSLLHLEAIKARNKPMEPAKKPAAAPFFLPTVAGLSGNPTFDTSASGKELHGDGTGEDDDLNATAAAPVPATGSKVLRGGVQSASKAGAGGGAPAGEFLRLLRASGDAGDWASFMAYLRALSPVALDREVRALQLLTSAEEEGADDGGLAAAAVHDLASLLEAINSQLSAGMNFEFCAVLLQLLLRVHGDAIMDRPVLRGAAARVHKRLSPMWVRLDSLLADVRCMTAYFGNLQS